MIYTQVYEYTASC